MNKKEIKAKISEGHILFSTIIELIGKPKEHVKQTFDRYIKNIEKDKNYIVTKKDNSKIKKTDDGFFSIFSEMEILAEDMDNITQFAFNYMPASIEIIEPTEFKHNNLFFTDLFNNLQARLHEVDMIAKTAKEKNNQLNQSFNLLTENFIHFICKKNKVTAETLSKVIGIEKKVLEQFLESLVKNKKLKKEKDNYFI